MHDRTIGRYPWNTHSVGQHDEYAISLARPKPERGAIVLVGFLGETQRRIGS